MRMVPVMCVLLAGLAIPGAARADEPVVLRMATAAPERSGWARELAWFSRQIERETEGRIRLKWFHGSVAGDEFTVMSRIERGQLDGTASGGMMCGKVMPSMRALRVTGTFQNRAEAAWVMNQISPTLREEAAASGYELLTFAGLGPGVLFLRRPVTTMDELRRVRVWRWGLDDVAIATERAMGMNPVGLHLTEAGKAFDEGKIDGFYSIPTAALAFQWSVQAGYLLDLPGDYLTGCVLIASRALDRITQQDRQVLRAAGARVAVRIEEMGRRQDDELLRGGFARHGLKRLPVSAKLRAEFFAAARRARETLDERLVSRSLMKRVLGLLADYRAEHPR